jgi:hypothetical protein
MADPKDYTSPGARPNGDDRLVRESNGPPSATKKRKTLNLSLRNKEERIDSAHYLKEGWEMVKIIGIIIEIVQSARRFFENHHF